MLFFGAVLSGPGADETLAAGGAVTGAGAGADSDATDTGGAGAGPMGGGGGELPGVFFPKAMHSRSRPYRVFRRPRSPDPVVFALSDDAPASSAPRPSVF